MPVPPPPMSPALFPSFVAPLEESGKTRSARDRAAAAVRPNGYPFDAELDVAEVDERYKPGAAWLAKARTLSRSNLMFLSRRMCYVGRTLVVAVHRVDDKPLALIAKVVSCDYEVEGLYRVDTDLLPLVETPAISHWIEHLPRRVVSP